MSDEYEDENGEQEEESGPLRLQFTKDGKLGIAPETIEIDLESFKRLEKGLKHLKKKYPEILKECFP